VTFISSFRNSIYAEGSEFLGNNDRLAGVGGHCDRIYVMAYRVNLWADYSLGIA